MVESIYFFVTYARKKIEKEGDIVFDVSKKNNSKPVCIYKEEYIEEQRIYYNKVFAIDKSKKPKKNYNFVFHIGDDEYIISFEYKGNSFIYDVNLLFGKTIIDIRRNINQSKEYKEKMEVFIEALKENKEMDKIDELYKVTIELYSKKKIFSFLITLFLKIFEKKELCMELLNIFRKMNEDQKDRTKNIDRKAFLKNYVKDFEEITKPDKLNALIEKNKYGNIEFYGLILCYLNFYNYNSFSSIIKELQEKKSEDLFEILLIYNNHFKNPINQNEKFFYKFINYAIKKKDFEIFERGLDFIKDLETYITVIEENKEDFHKKYNSEKIKEIIRLDNLKFKKDSNSTKPEENGNNSGGEIQTATPDGKDSQEKNNIVSKKIKIQRKIKLMMKKK